MAPSSDFTEMDRHLLEECLEQENLLEEENVENPPTDYEEQIDYSKFKKLAEQQTSNQIQWSKVSLCAHYVLHCWKPSRRNIH